MFATRRDLVPICERIPPQGEILAFQGRNLNKTLIFRLPVAFVMRATAVNFNNIGRHGIAFVLVKSVFLAWVLL